MARYVCVMAGKAGQVCNVCVCVTGKVCGREGVWMGWGRYGTGVWQACGAGKVCVWVCAVCVAGVCVYVCMEERRGCCSLYLLLPARFDGAQMPPRSSLRAQPTRVPMFTPCRYLIVVIAARAAQCSAECLLVYFTSLFLASLPLPQLECGAAAMREAAAARSAAKAQAPEMRRDRQAARDAP